MATAQRMTASGRMELARARSESDKLFRLLAPGTLYERPVAERHRLIFYLGHLDAFDWNHLARRSMSAPAFSSGVRDECCLNAALTRHSQVKRRADAAKGLAIRSQKLKAIWRRTRAWIDSHLEELDPWILQMAIEHRHMHAETLSYLLHGLPYDRKVATRDDAVPYPSAAPPNPMVAIDAGSVTLGKTLDSFGWDNEHLAHAVAVGGFRMSKFKISNGEYMEFVRAGGAQPHFWRRENDRWFYRGMFGEIPLPLDWPVWVTWQQASDYAAWKGLKLPTEAQFQLAELTTADPVRDNFDFERWG